MRPLQHLLWVSERADRTGGCERYIEETAKALHRLYKVRSSLLFTQVGGHLDTALAQSFLHTGGGVFPLADPASQLAHLKPDAVYVHRLETDRAVAVAQAARAQKAASLRFFHDHALFCPREHKYTVLGKQTCTRTVGAGCFTCLGVINKAPRGVKLTLPMQLTHQHAALIQAFDGFVVGSGYMKGHVAAHGFAPERIHCLPLFTDAPREPVLPMAQRPTDTLVFAGQMTTGKGVDTLLTALAQLKAPAHLRLFGTGKFLDDYRALAQQLGVETRVSWEGKADSATLEKAFRQASVVVFPSRTPETFGLIGPEAFRYATPVVGTTVGGMTEWLKHEKNGLAVPPNEPAALAQALERLLADPALRTRLGENGRQDWQERFTPEKHAQQLFAALEQARKDAHT